MSVFKISQENFDSEVIESELPVVLDFWASWCMPCVMMGPVFESVSEKFSGKLKFGKVNVDEENELANEFQIRGIPTLVFFRKGKKVNQISGYLPEDEFEKIVSNFLKSGN